MSFYKKNKFFFDILATIVLAAGSVMYGLKYAGSESRKMDLVTAIVSGMMAIFRLVDAVPHLWKKRMIESKSNSQKL